MLANDDPEGVRGCAVSRGMDLHLEITLRGRFWAPGYRRAYNVWIAVEQHGVAEAAPHFLQALHPVVEARLPTAPQAERDEAVKSDELCTLRLWR